MSASKTVPWTFKNQNSIPENYKCSWCNNLFREPKQLECGHRICSACFPATEDVIQCRECKETSSKSELIPDKGFKNDMQKINVMCISCDWQGFLKDYERHVDEYHRVYECSYCQEQCSTPEALKIHQEKVCEKIPVHCALHQHGCKDQLYRPEMKHHYLTAAHQTNVVNLLTELSSKLSSGGAEMQSTLASGAAVSDEHNGDLEGVRMIMDTFSEGVTVLQQEVLRLEEEKKGQLQVVEKTNERLPKMKASIEETRAAHDASMTNMKALQHETLNLKQRWDDQQCASFDGTTIWRITDVAAMLNAAESERQLSVYSPPFYSSKTGYKMCARLYPNGDGNARHSHISLFFVLMRTKHDAVLNFPFKYKVTFCLFDLTGRRQHHIDSFRPDPKSNSFQRPKSEMNIASGIPKFIALNRIKEPNSPFVKNDTIFIRVMVDFTDLPKKVLPFALTLNPALPMHIQQVLINKELEQQSKQNSTSNNT